ncbi:hypothetical protein PISL3812_09762 [Talaromyces islandicus]|uniref:Uncharacterized protein n=1 Tax=Talaromyces islandicus TaxID=28573 RepID=A0A0U1MAP9_TALIS|nr:hypothetical protein PISL3812_09762 [Talaromyces islandicus]
MVRTPSARELVVDGLARIGSKRAPSAFEDDFQINCQGEVNESIDPTIVLAQLVDPDPCCPAFLTGLRLPSVERCGFRCPYALCEVLEPEGECNIQVNMTPKFSSLIFILIMERMAYRRRLAIAKRYGYCILQRKSTSGP